MKLRKNTKIFVTALVIFIAICAVLYSIEDYSSHVSPTKGPSTASSYTANFGIFLVGYLSKNGLQENGFGTSTSAAEILQNKMHDLPGNGVLVISPLHQNSAPNLISLKTYQTGHTAAGDPYYGALVIAGAQGNSCIEDIFALNDIQSNGLTVWGSNFKYSVKISEDFKVVGTSENISTTLYEGFQIHVPVNGLCTPHGS